MNPDLVLATQYVYDPLSFNVSDVEEEAESKEYSACTFLLNGHPIKFRTAKITPTKVGAFVTLWKRDASGITCPHHESDAFDRYVISIRKGELFGQFIFPRSVLIKQGILSSAAKAGKRGFRVYASWDLADNKQAIKTQTWQSQFFMEIGTSPDLERARVLYAQV